MAGVVAGHRDIAGAPASSFEIIVFDDGNTDATWAALDASRAATSELRLMRNPSRAGVPFGMTRLYGDARGEWIYFAPADGRRIPRRDPASRVLIAQVYSTMLRWIFRLPVRDIDSVKLYRADELRAVPARSESNFFEAEILIALCSRGRTVREIDIPHTPRIAGAAKGVTPADAFLALRDVSAFTIGWLFRRGH